jgi:hypothetical protein
MSIRLNARKLSASRTPFLTNINPQLAKITSWIRAEITALIELRILGSFYPWF